MARSVANIFAGNIKCGFALDWVFCVWLKFICWGGKQTLQKHIILLVCGAVVVFVLKKNTILFYFTTSLLLLRSRLRIVIFLESQCPDFLTSQP